MVFLFGRYNIYSWIFVVMAETGLEPTTLLVTPIVSPMLEPLHHKNLARTFAMLCLAMNKSKTK